MRKVPNNPTCMILTFPFRAEQPKPEAPVLWGQEPARVLQKLRQLRGEEWWR